MPGAVCGWGHPLVLAPPLGAGAGECLSLIHSCTCQLTAFSDNKAAYVCGAVAEDLQEATTYYYRVGDGEHWSSVRSFTTGYQNTGIQALVLGDLQESNNANLEGILNACLLYTSRCV